MKATKFLPRLTLLLCLLCLSAPSWAATYTQVLTVAFGTGQSGQAANVRLTVYDNAGTIQIASTNTPSGNAITESTDATGAANTGTYLTRATIDTAWLPVHTKWTLVGQVGVAASAVVGSDRAAALADGLTAARLTALDTTATNAATAATQATAANTASSANGTALASNATALTGIQTTATAIKAKTDLVATNAQDSPNQSATQSSVTTIQTRLGAPTGASVSADIAGNLTAINALPSATQNAAQVWAATTRSLTDKTGFSLTQAFPANFALLGINGTGQYTANSLALAPTGSGGASVDPFGLPRTGTPYAAGTWGSFLGTPYAGLTPQEIASIWAAPTRTLTGVVQIDMTQPLSTAQMLTDTLGGGLWGGASALRKIVISGSTLTVYQADGVTVLKAFTLSPTPTAGSKQ